MPAAEVGHSNVTRWRRVLIALVWVLGLSGLGAWVAARLDVSGDLRLFMPSPRNDDQRLLLDSLGDGAGARVLLVALSGAAPERLAETSAALSDRLGKRAEFRHVVNGASDLSATVEGPLLPYRYLLSPTLDEHGIDAGFLRRQLTARIKDLGSPAAALIEPLVARDPTLEMLRLAERWQREASPDELHGVWFTRDGDTALMVVETRDGGFDPTLQRLAIGALRRAFADARTHPDIELEISGPAAFGVHIEERTRSDATRLGLLSSVLMLLLFGAAYRSWSLPLLGALPLASAALAGLAAVSLLFPSVHGITLAFGFTLLGVVQDYPVHLFSHHRAGSSARTEVRALWPTLATGVVSTCLAYSSFFAAGVEGLRQLAVFTITGLLVAAACTRWLLPLLLGDTTRDVAELGWVHRAWRALGWLPRLRTGATWFCVAALASLFLSATPYWDDDLSHLTPVDSRLLERDRALRDELGAPDVRYLLVIDAADGESLLQRSEAIEPGLRALVEAGTLAGFELPSRYLPSTRTQQLRQSRLPDRQTLDRALAAALVGLPFRAGVFADFRDDVEAARTARPLTLATLGETPLAARLTSLVREHRTGISAQVSLTGVADSAVLRAFIRKAGPGVRLLDLKQASETLASAYRDRVLLALGGALVLLVLAVWFALRRPRRVARVMLPVLLSTLLVVATLHACGVAFNLFHLIAMILGAGLGLDYALFFEHGSHSPAAQRRTLHAVLVCALATAAVFGLLATSSIPVLRAIGVTVTIAVVCNFFLAAMFAAGSRGDYGSPEPSLPAELGSHQETGLANA